MIIVISENVGTFELTQNVVSYYAVADFGVQTDVISKSLGTVAGQLLVYNGSQWVAVDPPLASGLVLVSDTTLPGKWKTGSAGGGGGVITLTNNDATEALTGSIAIADLTADKKFKSTTVPNCLGIIGVAAEDISAAAEGDLTIAGLGLVLVTGNVSRGEWLVSSSTAWRAKSAGYSKPLYGAIGYALTSYGGGGSGSVYAVIVPNPMMLTTAGTGWFLGGYTTTTTTDAQKFTIASATWANVPGAALPSATNSSGGIGNGTTAGYTCGGSTGGGTYHAAGYKTTFATETTAANASLNLPANRGSLKSGYNCSTHGYIVGGYTAAALATATKLPFSTETMSAVLGTTLSAARTFPIGVSDGTLCYAQGGVSATQSDKITFASDTVSDNNAGDITSSATAYSGGMSFPGGSGYMAMKTGATANSKRIDLTTGTSANVTSTLAADQDYTGSVCDGSGLGWQSGDDAAPYTVTHKFVKATETYSSDAGAALAVGKFNPAYFNNGAL